MKFNLTNSGCDNDLKKKYPYLLKKYKAKAVSREKNYWGETEVLYSVDIPDMETLASFIKDAGNPIVINSDNEIEIYDNFRE